MGRSRRGVRTGQMVRIASERIHILYSLARKEAGKGDHQLMRRHVQLARRIGTRYNVRLPRDLSRATCKDCNAYLLPGATSFVRVGGGLIRTTCELCGAVRRFGLEPAGTGRIKTPQSETSISQKSQPTSTQGNGTRSKEESN